MGLWQHLVTSYEKNADALQIAYPLSSTTISNNGDDIVVVVIDGEGRFQGHSIIPKRPTGSKRDTVPLEIITIPVSEASMGRSSGVCPHPLFDQYGYMKGDGKKYDAYLAQLNSFACSEFATDSIRAVYEYMKKGSLHADLRGVKCKDKTNILFQVEIPGSPQAKLWHDMSMFDAWHQFYMSQKEGIVAAKSGATLKLQDKDLAKEEKKHLKDLLKLTERKSVDYITGAGQLVAVAHPKKLSNGAANSKLVSDNDSSNYTFRGKYESPDQAVAIGYESSQKAHQFLRYLIKERGISCGEQVIVSFTVGSIDNLPPPPVEEKGIWEMAQDLSITTEKDKEGELRARTGFDYADSLRKSIAAYSNDSAQKEHDQTVVVAFDAATTGRLSIIFYRELARGEYLERIADWHDGCKWHQQFKDVQDDRVIHFVGAPSVDRIIQAVYGKPRGGNDESYIKIKKTARERLLRCVFDGADIPHDYIRGAVNRSSNPLAVTRNGKFNRYDFMQLISTACAMVRKNYQQRNGTKEVYDMSIELDRTDRNYLYGRLLGAADKLEEYALYRKDNKRVVTAAIRHMQAFAQRPFRTWNTIHGCLNPYIQQVKDSFAFNEIENIMEKFEVDDYERDAPLSGAYLIGYYHERKHIEELVKKYSTQKQIKED